MLEGSDLLPLAQGNFGRVIKRKFKNQEYLLKENRLVLYADQGNRCYFGKKLMWYVIVEVALKDVEGGIHDYYVEQRAFSREVSCNFILHPNLVRHQNSDAFGRLIALKLD